jgi:glycosyltransferase involved in cell wall biosynthesis
VQIAILIPLRYPTEKAYGVNIAYTVRALCDEGNNVTTVTFGHDSIDVQGNQVIGVRSQLLKIAKSIRDSNHFKVSALGFYLFQLFFSFTACRYLKKKRELPTLLITRSPVVAFFSSRLLENQPRVILELHHIPNSFEKILINLTSKEVFLVITNSDFGSQLSQIGILKDAIVIPNMSPDSFHKIGKLKHLVAEPLNIGFAGKSTSSGNDNGLWVAIELLENSPELLDRIRFTFVGCEESFRSKVSDAIEQGLISHKSIVMTNHLSHNELLKEVVNFDLALIPYPEEPYYERSFPIKIIEMASAGVPMLISNTKAHRRILGEPNLFFFEPRSYLSLVKTLHSVLKYLNSISIERQRLLLLAEAFTYKNKAIKFLEIGKN